MGAPVRAWGHGGSGHPTELRANRYTAVAADDSAGTVDIETGLGAIRSLHVMIYRSGVPLYSDQAVSFSGGTITVADGAATYALTAGDVIDWQAAGDLA